MNRIPDNEFSEQFTGDMPTEDSMWHAWMQPKYKHLREKKNKDVHGWINDICVIIQTLCIVIVTYFLIGFMISVSDRAERELQSDMGGKINERVK